MKASPFYANILPYQIGILLLPDFALVKSNEWGNTNVLNLVGKCIHLRHYFD